MAVGLPVNAICGIPGIAGPEVEETPSRRDPLNTALILSLIKTNGSARIRVCLGNTRSNRGIVQWKETEERSKRLVTGLKSG